MQQYSDEFKAKMVKKMLAPPGMSAMALAQESGVSQGTLSRWLRQAGTVLSVSNDSGGRRPADWSSAEKLQAVIEVSRLSGDELGAYLRRNGLHEADVNAWRELAEGSFETDRSPPRKSAAEKKRIQELERKLIKAEKKLRAADAIIELQKKVQLLWADEDDGTTEKSGKD